MLREVVIHKQLNHPNIIKLLGVWADEGAPIYMVLPRLYDITILRPGQFPTVVRTDGSNSSRYGTDALVGQRSGIGSTIPP